MSDHPSPELLQLYGQRLTSAEQTSRITHHLLDGCAACRAVVAAGSGSMEQTGDPEGVAEVEEAGTIAEAFDPFDAALEGALEVLEAPRAAGSPTSGAQEANLDESSTDEPRLDSPCPSTEEISELLLCADAGRSPDLEARLEVLSRHLLAACATCRARVAEAASLQPLTDEQRVDAMWNAAVDAAEQRQEQLVPELAAAPAAVEALFALPVEQQEEHLRANEELHTWAVAEELLEQAYAVRFDDPREMLRRNELALVAAQLVAEDRYGHRVVDLLARAWAELSNPQRILSDLQGAEGSLGRAKALLDKRPFDQRSWSAWLGYSALLVDDRGRYLEAIGWTHRLLAENPWQSDSVWFQNSAAIHQVATINLPHAHPSPQAESLRERASFIALSRARLVGDPTTTGAALVNRATFLKVTNPEEARNLLEEAEDFLTFLPEAGRAATQAIRGQFALAWGDYNVALAALPAAIHAYESSGQSLRAHKIRIHHAYALIAVGRHEDARQEAVQAYRFFRTKEIDRHISRALSTVIAAENAADFRRRLERLRERIGPRKP